MYLHQGVNHVSLYSVHSRVLDRLLEKGDRGTTGTQTLHL